MEIKIKGKEYHFNMNTQIGPYYRYEVKFGTSFQDDLQIFSANVCIVRLIFAVLQNDNVGFDLTFDEFLSALTDEDITNLSEFITQRFNALRDIAAEGKEDNDGKND